MKSYLDYEWMNEYMNERMTIYPYSHNVNVQGMSYLEA